MAIDYRFQTDERRLTVLITGEDPVEEMGACMQRMIKDFASVGGRVRALVDLRGSTIPAPREEALDLAESFSAALKPLRSRVALLGRQNAVFQIGRMVEKSAEAHAGYLGAFASEEKARQWLAQPLQEGRREESRR